MFVNKEVCEIVLIISDCTGYEFFAAVFIELSRSVYYYHVIFAYIDRRENGKRLVEYGFNF